MEIFNFLSCNQRARNIVGNLKLYARSEQQASLTHQMPIPHMVAGYLTQARELALLAIGFFVLALLVKGRRALTDSRAATKETKNNVGLFVLETLAVAPYFGLAVGWVHAQVHGTGNLFAGAPLWLVEATWPQG